MKTMINALNDFQAAYNALVEAWNEHNPDLSKDYPFNVSLDEINVDKWVKSSLMTLDCRTQLLLPSDENYSIAVECCGVDNVTAYFMLECGRADGPLYFVRLSTGLYYALVYNEEYETASYEEMIDWLKIR